MQRELTNYSEIHDKEILIFAETLTVPYVSR